MPPTKLQSGILLATLLLIFRSGQAQTRPAPKAAEPTTSELTVRVTLPAALTAVKDYATIIVSKDQDKLKKIVERRKRKTENPVLTFSFSLPKTWVNKLAGNN
ncbi:hypothetical protein GCM10022408_35530 [Hymenobacter fastidiosus]|uniref:Uncharacterized protein n=1 Tax=Hymenobacter fastidiosus TaxID=486264 RepID=A0ABP7T108_9BACT